MAPRDDFADKVMGRLWLRDDHVIAPDDLGKLRDDAARMFDEGWTVEDASALLRCTEEVTPDLPEEVALRRMKTLTDKYRR